jgi:diguanylate cyclase (GGDEF)-like protein
MHNKLLVVEDTRMFSRVLKSRLEKNGYHVTLADSLARAKELVTIDPGRFFLAILDLNLPDAPQGEIVDYILGNNIPSIVFTSQFNDNTREMMIHKKVVDYVAKDDPSSIDYVINLVSRLDMNRNTLVLVVDDSTTARNITRNLLQLQQYQVVEAVNGIEALEKLKQFPDIRIVLTDYMMPEMDGFELTKAIRQEYSRNEIAVIGISAHDGNILSAKFMKNGASDFITKPFLVEEFNCRVNQNVELISHIHALQEAVIRDYLTGLHNRRYFFDVGEKLFSAAVHQRKPLAVAMLDIDHFKRINDTYGHDLGDVTLKQLAFLLQKFDNDVDIIARTGGEEFCLLLTDMSRVALISFFEHLRKQIELLVIDAGETTISITASIGVCCKLQKSLDAMVACADEHLYTAKEGGRNKVSLS